eukprot:m51a1_g11717 hypothetical protein (271) ;mRNA; f:85954-87181
MAANYWNSTQAKMVAECAKGVAREPDRVLSEEQIRVLNVFFAQNIIRPLGKALSLRHRVVATAILYFKRYYLKMGMSGNGREGDPFKIAPACLYLATKSEECNTLVKKIHTATDNLMKELGKPFFPYQFKLEDLMEAEYEVLSALDFRLMVFHGYRTLKKLQENGEADLADSDTRQAVWSAMNDMYLTDAPLMYPPHVVALGAILVGAQYFRERDMRAWFATVIGPEMRDVFNVAQMLLDVYDLIGRQPHSILETVRSQIFPLLHGPRSV